MRVHVQCSAGAPQGTGTGVEMGALLAHWEERDRPAVLGRRDGDGGAASRDGKNWGGGGGGDSRWRVGALNLVVNSW